LSEAILGGPSTQRDAFTLFLDSPRRVILEVKPTQRIGYDGGKMGKATSEWMAEQATKTKADKS